MGELRKRGSIWWIRYYRNGQRHEESAGSDKKGVAVDLLRIREGDIAKGAPVSARIGRLRFDEAAADVINDFKANGKRSLDVVTRRIDKHLRPFFGGRKMASITTADVRAYVAERQAATEIASKAYTRKRKDGTEIAIPERRRESAGASAAEINRELATLKRIFTLAVQGAKLLHRPHIPMLREDNTRTGFFEPDHYTSVMTHLPAEIRPVIEFAYVTGWRIESEVLPLEWRQVDFRGGEIRLDAGTTKNGEGRVFPMTDDLRRLLEAQHEAHSALRKAGHVVPWVFWRMVAKGRRGPKAPRRITSFSKAWKAACIAAGCPGRIPHDLRRTAIRNMVRRGVPERVAMKLTGHKTPSVFARYNIVSDGDLRTAAVQLAGLTAKAPSLQSTPTQAASTAR
jgi:integrase